jgi:predicted kinase
VATGSEGGTAWVVAGPPGAGKSTVARLLAASLRPPGALLDKDTVYGSFVDAALHAAGRPSGEREGDWYAAHVKVHEYRGLAATAREIRAAGTGVVLVAPYTEEIHDADRWAALVTDLGGDPVRLVWTDCDPETLHARLVSRASMRDTRKLADYPAFVRRMRPGQPPAVPHVAIDTRGDPAGLADQIAPLVAR